jgi:hypothetical protein
VSIFDQIDTAFVDVLYPEILWREFIPAASVKGDVNPGAQNYGYRSRDIKGMGQFVNGDVRNVPRVGQVVGQVTVPILYAAIGATLTDYEAMQYSYGMQSALANDLGDVMKRGTEYHVERTYFFGNTAAGFAPFLDYPTVAKSAMNAWANGTPGDWVDSINDLIVALYLASKTVHLPDTVFLPPAKIAMMMAPMTIGGAGNAIYTNALEYLKKNNFYTAMTGKELTVKSLRYLTGAGVNSVDRCIVAEWNDRNFVLPFPMPYQLAQPVPIPLGVDMFAHYVFGSFHVKFPGAMIYGDGL